MQTALFFFVLQPQKNNTSTSCLTFSSAEDKQKNPMVQLFYGTFVTERKHEGTSFISDFCHCKHQCMFCPLASVSHFSVTLLREGSVQHRAVRTVPPAGERIQQPGWMSRRSHGGEGDWVAALRAQCHIRPRGEQILGDLFVQITDQLCFYWFNFFNCFFAEMVQKVTASLDIWTFPVWVQHPAGPPREDTQEAGVPTSHLHGQVWFEPCLNM